jgi:hypothetical protein
VALLAGEKSRQSSSFALPKLVAVSRCARSRILTRKGLDEACVFAPFLAKQTILKKQPCGCRAEDIMKTSDQSTAWGARPVHVASKDCRDGLPRRSGAETGRPPFLAFRQKHLPGLRLILFSLLIVLITISASAQIQQAWVAKYNNGITDGTSQAVKMVLDNTGNIYVTGFSQNTNTNFGYVTIKYAPNGNQLWSTRYDSTNFPTARAQISFWRGLFWNEGIRCASVHCGGTFPGT